MPHSNVETTGHRLFLATDANGSSAKSGWDKNDSTDVITDPTWSIEDDELSEATTAMPKESDMSDLEIEPLHKELTAPTKAGKKKRNKKKNQRPAIPTKTLPAMTTVRGFTPAASGDEDSDYAIRSPKSNASPAMRPASACGGISALKLQLENLNMNGSLPNSRPESKLGTYTPSTFSVRSDPGSDETDLEIPIEDDFISKDAEGLTYVTPDGEQINVDLTRKVTALDFEPLTCLGKGSFGTVLLVRHIQTGKLYAQKQLRKASLVVKKRLVEQTKTERTILESVNRHPFVVKLFYAFQDHEKLYLILEYAQGGELFNYLATQHMLTEDVAAFYMAELVLALEHLHHDLGVVYRDLKPENCLLDATGHLLLTDFGLSKVAVDEERCTSILGTAEYMAPEVIQGRPYGKECDWWSLGILGFDLMTGSPPFSGNNQGKIQEKIVKSKLTFPYFLSPDAKDLLTRLLRKEPAKRLGYRGRKDIQIIKSHRFFRGIDWKSLEKRAVMPPIQPVITDPALAENFAKEFTELAVSPVTERSSFEEVMTMRTGSLKVDAAESNPFGGFSFVAPASLLKSAFADEMDLDD